MIYVGGFAIVLPKDRLRPVRFVVGMSWRGAAATVGNEIKKKPKSSCPWVKACSRVARSAEVSHPFHKDQARVHAQDLAADGARQRLGGGQELADVFAGSTACPGHLTEVKQTIKSAKNFHLAERRHEAISRVD